MAVEDVDCSSEDDCESAGGWIEAPTTGSVGQIVAATAKSAGVAKKPVTAGGTVTAAGGEDADGGEMAMGCNI